MSSNSNEYSVADQGKLKVCSKWTFRKFTFEWTIDNFTMANPDDPVQINSPKFTIEISEEEKYVLNLACVVSDISVYIIIVSKEKELPRARIKYLLKGNANMPVKEHLAYFNSSQLDLGKPKDVINDYLVNDKLTVLCEFHVGKNLVHEIQCIDNAATESKTNDYLITDLQKLLRDQNFCDVTLKVNEKEFKLHKAVLAARSTVFAAMFQNEMKEKETNIVQIDGFSSEIMDSIITYIYTGNSLRLNTMTEGLYKAADYYDIFDLKQKCAKQLISKLSNYTVIDTLLLADSYNDKFLKENVLEYVSNNARAVFNLQKWKDLESTKSPLVQDVYRAALVKLK